MKKFYSLILGLLVSVGAFGATFNLFSPASGVLKGNPSTYVTTSATSLDIKTLWTGTCDNTTYLRGDGTCATPPGTGGTVTSVGLTVPSGFSVTGSPVTTSGTLAISGTLNPVAGGTGVATLTGIAKGNGTSAFTAAVSSDVISTWGGTCDATTYLRGDGSCVTPPSGGTSANPSASVGLTAVNGSASTFMRSDGAPALSQSIVPTWTGLHTFSGTGSRISLTGGGTSSSGIDWVNTGGTLWAGVDNSGGGAVISGGSAYGAVLATTGATALTLGTNGAARVPISSAGNVTINAPSSGTGLTVNGLSDQQIRLNAATGQQYTSFYLQNNSVTKAGMYWDNVASEVGLGGFIAGSSTRITAGAAVAAITISPAGNVTISAPSSGETLTINSGSGQGPKVVCSAGVNCGLQIQDGKTGTRTWEVGVGVPVAGNLYFYDNVAGAARFVINTSGAFGLNGANYGTAGQVLSSGGSGAAPSWGGTSTTFTCGWSGFSSAPPNTTITYTKVGSAVTLRFPASNTGTSNSTSFQMTSLPAEITPTANQSVPIYSMSDNGTVIATPAMAIIRTDNTISFYKDGNTGAWTNSGTKGFTGVTNAAVVIHYMTD